MSAELETDIFSLATLDFIPYISEDGQLPAQLAKAVGVYAIFDADQTLQYVGYSRDVVMSLKQHLVRCPHLCHWLKVKTIDQPRRAILEGIQASWIAENGDRPPGNSTEADQWTDTIDTTTQMTPEEQATYAAATGEVEQTKVLKQVARRVEAEILAALEVRGVKDVIRFDPKLKEKGLLSIKPAK
ncbi:MAG: GIY-YIG nuclease family protein [Leptolyngbyaceae bacterium]|nr:GIY-YIG nuclease family protein [Leptolyngbyaceae bacterium]